MERISSGGRNRLPSGNLHRRKPFDVFANRIFSREKTSLAGRRETEASQSGGTRGENFARWFSMGG
ncbi:hypothetical protein WN48_09428 [Eufriesea mexicana]|nr:hypothetical protein WN48_09428 [Eufriesea mexicana]